MIINSIKKKCHFNVAIIGGGCGGINIAGHLNKIFSSVDKDKFKIAIF